MFVRNPGYENQDDNQGGATSTTKPFTAALLALQQKFPKSSDARIRQIQNLLLEHTCLEESFARMQAAVLDKVLDANCIDDDILQQWIAANFAGHAERYILRWVELDQCRAEDPSRCPPIESSMATQRKNIVATLRALCVSGCDEIKRCVADTHAWTNVLAAMLERAIAKQETRRIGQMVHLMHQLHTEATTPRVAATSTAA